MIVIENKNKVSDIIGRVLLASNIEVVGWDSSVVPLYRMLEDKKPDLLIYGQEAHMNGSEYIKQRFPNLVLVYVGDDPAGKVEPDLVIGKSSTRKCVGLPESLYDITGLPSGTKKPSMSCKMCCFTDSIDQDMAKSISDIILDLFERKTRFFGRIKLDAHQYLGIVSEQERVDIISSADIYVDLTANYWHKSVMLGTTPIVLTGKHIPGINTFTDKESLEKAIAATSEGSYDISIAREQVVKNTGFDFCANIFSAIGAEEARGSVLQFKEKFI
tara:strand:- start:1287 stop:2105 length:819 start_codon:yes stop_codon:yes gene_type:complete